MDMTLNPRDLLRILWRRKWFFLLPAVLVVAGAIGAILTLPPLYRSQATLLVESQDVSENVVPSLVTEQIDRRIEIITREVLTTDNLVRIAERNDLYSDERADLSGEAIAAKMRSRLGSETLLTEFNDQRSGRRGLVTLGFQIYFLDAEPTAARNVVNDLVSIYISRNLENRRDVADRTADFLSGELQTLDSRIASIEDEFTRFKTENRELLPAEAQFKRQMLNNVDQRLRAASIDLRVLRERESYLATQLALIDEFDAPGEARGGTTPETRLELMRAELAMAQARYSSSHPDVVRLKRQVRSLQGLVNARAGTASASDEEAALSAELASLRERYTDEHPDVQRVRRELAAVRQSPGNGTADTVSAGASRTTSYVQLSAQLNSVRAEIAAVEDQQAQLEEERFTLQEQLSQAPAVEREFIRLERRMQNAVADRDQLADKESTVRLSGSLEGTSAGERLTLIEPPAVPRSPSSPNTKLILAIGLVLGVGSGGVSSLLAEFLDRSIRSRDDLARIVGDQPLVVIPFIRTEADSWRRWYWRLGAAAAVLLVLGASLTRIHYQIVPLDVLRYQATNEAERWVSEAFSKRPEGDTRAQTVQ